MAARALTLAALCVMGALLSGPVAAEPGQPLEDGAAAGTRGRFTDHGIGARVAESRGIVATHTSDGRYLVIANALDAGARGYVLVTDVDSEETRQVYCPEGVPQSAPYASLLASSGRFYTAQGRVLLELDPVTASWTFHGTPSPEASAYLSFTEAPDGTVWAGAVYRTTLISFDPRTRAMVDHGRLDEEEKYLRHLAADETGWVYGGVGTARGNIVAYHADSGERRSVVPEAERVTETCVVLPTVDGAVHGTCAGRTYRLYAGLASAVEPSAVPPRRPVGNIYWGQRTATFPDGRRVRAYNLPEGWLEVDEPAVQAPRRITFTYDAAGVGITSLGLGPEGVVYGSTAHPMRFLSLDSGTGLLTDHGGIAAIGGGNFCAIASQGDLVIGAQYSHGRLWLYDVTAEWNPEGGNPRWVAEWPRDVTRPRTVLAHPDGRHLLMGGFADYGYCGGGIGIYDLQTGEAELLSAADDLLAGHSPITLVALADGSLVGGTSVDAPGGGHPTATEAEVFLLDWPARRVAFRTVPVAGSRHVVSLAPGPDGLVHGLTAESTYFVFDPGSREVVHRASFAAYGSVPRHALQLTAAGSLYAVLGRAILRLGGRDFGHEVLDATPVTATAGGALVADRLYFGAGARVWSYELPRSAVYLPALGRLQRARQQHLLGPAERQVPRRPPRAASPPTG